jgi:hypothetical protein
MRSNLGLKIFALVIAVLIWLQLALISDHYSVVSLKLEVVNKPEALTLDQEMDRIPFRIHGKGLDILKLLMSPTRIQIDAGELKAGINNLPIRDYEIINRPQNLALDFIGPAVNEDLAVSTDVLMQKTVRVSLNFADDNARKLFEDKNFFLTPDRVTISGPRSRMASIDHVKTQRISSNTLKNNEFEIGLQLPNREFSANLSKVQVSVASTQMLTRIIESVPVSDEAGRQFMPAYVTIKVQGTTSDLNNLNPGEIRVNPVNPNADGDLYELEVVLPEGISQLDITPHKVRLRK